MNVPKENTNSTYGVENDFVFSTYFLALRDAWKGSIANDKLITTLYEIIGDSLQLENRKGDSIGCSPSTASRIKRRLENAHGTITAHCKDASVSESIVKDFAKVIIPRLQESKIDLLVQNLMTAIRRSRCSKSTIERLEKLSVERPPTTFLARALQESLSWPNRLSNSQKQEPMPQEESLSTFPKYNGKIDPEVPSKIAEDEMPYVRALVRVYGEEENAEFVSADEIEEFPRYKRHLLRQRRDYYSAEFIRRCMRDAYKAEGDNQFEILEEEVFNGIIDIHERKFDTGRQRLDEVLTHAANLNMDGVWVNHNTDWIRTYVKKGVCHVLVNNRRIRGWLDGDR